MRLPGILVEGKKYYLDLQLSQLRAVDNPHDFIDFQSNDDLDDWLETRDVQPCYDED